MNCVKRKSYIAADHETIPDFIETLEVNSANTMDRRIETRRAIDKVENSITELEHEMGNLIIKPYNPDDDL